jgi:hypothetical protein
LLELLCCSCLLVLHFVPCLWGLLLDEALLLYSAVENIGIALLCTPVCASPSVHCSAASTTCCCHFGGLILGFNITLMLVLLGTRYWGFQDLTLELQTQQ